MRHTNETPSFPQLEIPTDALLGEHASGIIKAFTIDAANQRRLDRHNSQLLAEDIVADARSRAAEIIKVANDEAAEAYQARLDSIDLEIAAVLNQVSENLGGALATSVEAIFRHLFHRDPSLLFEATLELAREVLEHEAGNVLNVNASDLEHEALMAMADRFIVHSNDSVTAGTLRIRGDQGEIRVDATKFIRDLGQDLRQCFQQTGTLSLTDRANP